MTDSSKETPDRAETLANVRRMYPAYKDVDDDTLANGLATKYPQYNFLAVKSSATGNKEPEARPGAAEIVGKNIAKIPERAAADVKGAVETFRNPSMAATLPLAVPGAGIATRIGTAAMGKMMDKPSTDWKENLATAMKAAGLSGIAEAMLGGVAKVPIPKVGSLSSAAESAASRTRAFDWATKAPGAAMDAIKTRILGAKVIIPSIDPAKKITLEEAAKELATREGPAYQQTLAEIVNVLNRVDKQRLMGGPRPYAGADFKRRVSAERFQPPPGSTMERAASQVVPALQNPALRAAADLGGQENIPGTDLPIAGAAGMGALQGAGSLADVVRHIPHLMK